MTELADAEDATPDTPQPDAADPDVSPDEGYTAPAWPTPGDGALGAYCNSDADCEPEAPYCLGDYCTNACGGADDCAEPSAEAFYDGTFECAAPFPVTRYCAPGGVEGADIRCRRDADCGAFGPEHVCAHPVFWPGGDAATVYGICLPGGDAASPGERCAYDFECGSKLCACPSGTGCPGATAETVCAQPCQQQEDCAAGELCAAVALGVLPSGEPAGLIGRCLELAGSLAGCSDQTECPPDESCTELADPVTGAPRSWCTASQP